VASPVDRIDGFEVLTRLTKRSVQFAYMVFLRREQGLTATNGDVAEHFKGCSEHLAASNLHEAADAGALRQDGDEWRVTPEGVAAFRIHFTGWGEQFDAAAEERGLA
jgi:hypothetical protein